MTKQYDVLVVGSGPGGQHAALSAAKLGKRVGLIERKPYIGGVSLQTGTIPSKALREAAFLVSRFAAKGMRANLNRQVSTNQYLSEAMRSKDMVIKQQESFLLHRLMKHGIDIIPGEAGFIDTHTLQVSSAGKEAVTYKADFIILATGSRPRRPANIPFDKERVLDSSSVLKLRRLPKSMVVVGGGVIACEFATIFAPLGVNVTMIDSHAQLLAYLDKDIASHLGEHMLDMGITLHMNTRIESIHTEPDKVIVKAGEHTIETDTVLYALGRQPNYDGLHIENAELVADDNGWIRINENFQTAHQHIYIIGDLAGSPALASTAMHQGQAVIQHAFSGQMPVTKSQLPMAIYTIPELSYIGETERQLTERDANYVTGKSNYKDTARGQIIGDHHGMLKMLADRKTRKILGVHIIGESASELIHVAQTAIHCDATVDMLANQVFNYPTLAECYRSAAQNCIDQLN